MSATSLLDYANEIIEASLRDWGEPVRLVRLRSEYVPEAGLRTRSTTSDQTVAAIVSRGRGAATPATAGGERSQDVLVLVRATDVDLSAVTGLFAVIDGSWFEVMSHELRPGNVCSLQTRLCVVDESLLVTAEAA